ncbi:MAG TPA: NAD(P)H-dependent glycerol-3-phosphate dehydrogenase [Erysipelotrichaceae bacterium]|nr:NAD(P)H-dependent glycerol-3-phosphate dehydrogenase [Erysipelotrichaceae bacterium]
MKIAIIGSGSWGTALAQVLADNQHDVTIWGRNLDELVDIQVHHMNEKYFPGVTINENIQASTEITPLLDAEVFLLAIPSEAIEDVCNTLNENVKHPIIVINVSKGFHPTTHQRLSVYIKEKVNPEILREVVSLIGPSHAEEVILRLPTIVNSVCENEEYSKIVQELFSNRYFRVYRNTDVIGAEIGVAVKNIIALASGMIQGLGYGDNARAALITRGLAEITRYGLAMGAKPETFLGLTGVGDLIVTCTSVHSRNFQAGLMIGKNDSAKSFWENNTKTVEGVKAAKIIHEEAKLKGIYMPITEEVYKVLYENNIPSISAVNLMQKELKSEEE